MSSATALDNGWPAVEQLVSQLEPVVTSVSHLPCAARQGSALLSIANGEASKTKSGPILLSSLTKTVFSIWSSKFLEPSQISCFLRR